MQTARRSFKDLVAWQRGMELVGGCYAVARALSVEERFELANQLRSAAVSVVANLAEGSGRPTTSDSRREYRRFVGMAIGSLNEVEALILIAKQERLAPSETLASAMDLVPHVGRLLIALHKSLAPAPRPPSND